jgi:alpha-L-rhamnosidase
MMDNWSSAGAKLPKQLVAAPAHPRPLEEVLFEALDPETVFFHDLEPIDDAIQRRHRGLWAQMIPLTEMMSQIVEINERTVQDRLLRSKILEDVETMGNKLDSWLLRLPRELQITPENLKQYADVGHARTLVALHLGFHHHAQVLYYQFLHHHHTDTPAEQIQRAEFANRCKYHASELSALLWLANSTPGCECLWVVTGHLLVISSSVQLHTLLFGDDDIQIESAKTVLKQNFEMMLNLRRYWPSLELSMSRLRAFHRACQESMHTSFAMDQWMLVFLQRYMAPVSDRVQHALMDDALDLPQWPTPVRDFGSELNYGGDASDSNSWYDGELRGSASDILQTFL